MMLTYFLFVKLVIIVLISINNYEAGLQHK